MLSLALAKNAIFIIIVDRYRELFCWTNVQLDKNKRTRMKWMTRKQIREKGLFL